MTRDLKLTTILRPHVGVYRAGCNEARLGDPPPDNPNHVDPTVLDHEYDDDGRCVSLRVFPDHPDNVHYVLTIMLDDKPLKGRTMRAVGEELVALGYAPSYRPERGLLDGPTTWRELARVFQAGSDSGPSRLDFIDLGLSLWASKKRDDSGEVVLDSLSLWQSDVRAGDRVMLGDVEGRPYVDPYPSPEIIIRPNEGITLVGYGDIDFGMSREEVGALLWPIPLTFSTTRGV